MSGISVKTNVTDNEKKAIQNQNTLYPPQTGMILHHDQINPKLLLCILETLQDIKQELVDLRKANERMEYKLNSIVQGNAVRNVNIHEM